MVDANSTGLGPAKTRSINVEVNLLHEWSASRAAMVIEIQRQLLMLGGICCFGLVALPVLSSWRNRVAASTSGVIRERVALEKQAAGLDLQVKEVAPSIDFAETKSKCNRYRNTLFTEANRFIDSTPAGVTFETLKIEANGGELQFKVVAYAKSAADGRRFVDAAGSGRNVTTSNQSAIRQSHVLDRDGVVFDYTKKVRVNR